MNRSNFALFVALLIHLFLMLVFWVLGSIIPQIQKEIPDPEKKIRISLKELPKSKKILPPIKKKPEILGEVKNIPEPIEIAPPMIKGSQSEKIVKRDTIKYEPKLEAKTPKLNPKEKQNTKAQVKQIKNLLLISIYLLNQFIGLRN